MNNFFSNLRFFLDNNILINVMTFHRSVMTLEGLSLEKHNDSFKVNFSTPREKIKPLKKLNQHLDLTDLMELPFKDVTLMYVHLGTTLSESHVIGLLSAFIAFYITDTPLKAYILDQMAWQIRYNNENDPRNKILSVYKKADSSVGSLYYGTEREVQTLYQMGSPKPIVLPGKPKIDETVITAFYTKINNDILEIYI